MANDGVVNIPVADHRLRNLTDSIVEAVRKNGEGLPLGSILGALETVKLSVFLSNVK